MSSHYNQAPVHLSCLGQEYQGTRSDFILATGTPKIECEFNCSIVSWVIMKCGLTHLMFWSSWQWPSPGQIDNMHFYCPPHNLYLFLCCEEYVAQLWAVNFLNSKWRTRPRESMWTCSRTLF